MNSRITENGFTLLEVLVALAVLAISMTALIKAVGVNTSNLSYLEERTFAHWVALNQLSELHLVPTSENTIEGSTHMAGREWLWQLNIEATEDDAVMRVDARVSRESAKDATLATITSYMGAANVP